MSNKKQTPPTETPEPRDLLLDDPELKAIFEQFPDAKRVSIKRMNEESDRWAHVGALPMDTFSEDAVQRKFGGGLYMFLIHGSDGRVLRRVLNIEIADPPEDDRPPKQPAAAAPAAAMPTSEIQLLREQASADRLLMLEVVRSIGQQKQQPQSDITQLVAALATLRSMEPKHEQPAAVQDLLLKSFTSGLEVAARLNKTGGGGSEASPLGEILGFVREVFQDARPIIQAAIANAVPPVAPGLQAPAAPAAAALPNPAPAPGDEEMDEMEIDLKPALEFVRQKLENGTAPATLAAMVLGQMAADPALNETLSDLIADEPIGSFLELMPELKTEPLRSRFGEFFGIVRARIFEARDTGGTGRNPADARKDAPVDARSD